MGWVVGRGQLRLRAARDARAFGVAARVDNDELHAWAHG